MFGLLDCEKIDGFMDEYLERQMDGQVLIYIDKYLENLMHGGYYVIFNRWLDASMN